LSLFVALKAVFPATAFPSPRLTWTWEKVMCRGTLHVGSERPIPFCGENVGLKKEGNPSKKK